ncbi:MAG: electron transfer flavoprotein subunit beta/FixA family protein [Candidatus Zixiibacteriota bacterium]
MRIVVCVKEVPDTTEVKIDPETNTLIRSGVPSIINPFDLNALEEALKLKDNIGAEVIVLSMGPPSVEKNLRELLAMGSDKAILLTDRAFAGADTWATSLTISEAIKKIGDVDLIITGKQAIDGDTAQVGPGIATFLDYPQVMFAQSIIDTSDSSIKLRRSIEDGHQVVEIQLPAVISIIKGSSDPRLPSLRGMMKAKKAEITKLTLDDLGLEPDNVGLSGSPTRVVKIFSPPKKEDGEKWEGEPTELATKLIDTLQADGLIS